MLSKHINQQDIWVSFILVSGKVGDYHIKIPVIRVPEYDLTCKQNNTFIDSRPQAYKFWKITWRAINYHNMCCTIPEMVCVQQCMDLYGLNLESHKFGRLKQICPKSWQRRIIAWTCCWMGSTCSTVYASGMANHCKLVIRSFKRDVKFLVSC